MILKIKDKLRGNQELIIDILNKLNCEYIKPLKNNEIRWGHSNAHKINIETLSYVDFSNHAKGDIITMISLLKDIKLGQAIQWLAKELNLSYEYTVQEEINLPFQGFFKEYSKVKELDLTPPKIYPINRLTKYVGRLNTLWLEEGISLKTQELFDIGLDFDTNRIVIGWKDVKGDLVGIIGRLNKKEITNKECKYLPIIPFNKSKVLYGLDINYKEILNCGTIVIAESEKSVIKAYSLGYKNVVALGGNNISERQAALIKSLCVNVIIALDEGINIKHSIEQAQKCKIENPFFSNNVFVLNSEGLPSKNCIFDLDKETIDKYFEQNLIYIQ